MNLILNIGIFIEIRAVEARALRPNGGNNPLLSRSSQSTEQSYRRFSAAS